MVAWDADDPLGLVEGESTKANQALHDYTGMGPARSLAGLLAMYQTHTEPRPPTKNISTLKEWSAGFSWVDRAAAWDAEARKREWAATTVVREARAAELADRNWSLSTKLTERVVEMLGFPLAQAARDAALEQAEKADKRVNYFTVKADERAEALAATAGTLGGKEWGDLVAANPTVKKAGGYMR